MNSNTTFFYDKLKQLLKDEVMNIINLLLQMQQLDYSMHLSKELKWSCI